MYAVFELVEKLGVTFLLTGDIVPAQRPSLEIPALDLRKEPAIGQRGFLMEASHHPSVTILGYRDYARMIDQMAKMKDNFLAIWWFAYSPFVKFSYRGETKLLGDIAGKTTSYLNSMYTIGGVQTTDDVTIGKQWFPGRRLVPPEMQEVETPDDAFAAAQNMMQRVIHYAKSRQVKIWLVDEISVAPPNLARYGERISSLPFETVYGTYMQPTDPVNREIQTNSLKAMIDTFPEAAGYFLNFPEIYEAQHYAQHREFYEQQQAAFKELETLIQPWTDRFNIGRKAMIDSNIGYFDLFKYLMSKRDEMAPKARLGLMTVGRGYVMPLFDKMLPKDIPFMTFDTGGRCGYGTPQGMPMTYFGGMGARDRIDTPYLDDDCEMLGKQFNVGAYTQKDRIFPDGVKNGMTGVAPWMAQLRGTEQNSSYLAQAAWEPDLTREEFYKGFSERLFGANAAPDMYRALMTLEEEQDRWMDPDSHVPFETLGCCGAQEQVRVVRDYSSQKNPFDGPTEPGWKGFISMAPKSIAAGEAIIPSLKKALESMRAAEPRVEPHGKHELAYIICRTEAYRDGILAVVAEDKALLAFDQAFAKKDSVPYEQFVADLKASLKLFEAAHQQAQVATTKYAEIIDHPSDLEALYRLNTGTLLGFDLNRRWIENVVNFHAGKPYAEHVPFERLFVGDIQIMRPPLRPPQ